ncbi:MAG: PKD domain-containing protein [Ferruginibacter sp.]
MSKYVLFFILLLSLNVSAQENAVIKASPSLQNTWDEQEPFVNGFARVLKNNKFSFINKSGKLVALLQFDGARNFSNHLAAVEKDNKWGFINESGELVVPLKYDIVYDFTETITGVFGNKRWWIINTKAEVTKALDVSVFYGFKNGVAKLVKNDRWGTMNVNGEIIFDKIQPAPATNNIVPFIPKTSSVTSGITVCPDNIDFEYGSFYNWKCFTGHVDSIGNTNVITLNPSPPTPNRHTLYNRVMPSAIDPYGLFPTNPPDGSNFALRLGNTLIGGEAEGTTYTIKVPANDSNFSIKYDYAVVFQNPGHTLWSQPRFQVKVFDSAANQYVDCASFEYISTSNLPGFAQSTVDTSVIYKPWSTVYLSLRGYAGKTMFLEFKNADCVRKGHWGYSYIDVEKPCGQSVEMNYDCTAPNITTLKGPPGFQIYNWWDQTFGTLLGTGQQIVLNPGPAINTTIWLEMIPFNDFGCLDTIPVKIDGVFTADFATSDTNGICAPHSFTFYNRNLPSTSVTWDFGDGTTGTGDTVTHVYNNVGSYLVKMDVIMAGGCIGTETKIVSVVQPAGSFSYTGGNFCDSQTVRFDAITSFVDSLFWDFGDGTTLATMQTSVTHTYNKPGVFIPSMIMKSAGGCETIVPATDTIKIEMLKVGYTNTDTKICGNTTVNFTDTSSSYFGISSIQWNFGDGNTGSGANVSHTYTATGTYNVRETITGVSGCSLSTVKPIYVKVNDAPVIAIAGPASACQSGSVTFTSTLQAIDSVNYYYWTSSNGYSGSGTSFAVPFNLPGNYTIKLMVRTINGCYDSTSQQIQINPTPDVVQLPNQILCNGSFTTAMNFTGAVPGTIYNWINTFAGIGIPSSGTGDIASFQAYSNGNYTANATITVTPTANGCPGLPKVIVLTVNPTPSVIQPANQTLCGNSNTTAIAFTGAVAGTTYNWTNNNTAIGLASGGTGDIPSFAATTNGGNITTATITVTPIFNGCPGTPKTFTITVNPTPDIVQPGNQTLCNNNNTTAIIFSGSVAGTTYNWINSNTSIGLAASGSGDIASFVATNTGTTSATSTITVTPSINGCTVPSKTFTITVHPTADVVQPANQNLCGNSNTAAITFSGAVPGTIYNWTNNNTSIGLAASGTGNIPSFAAISNGFSSETSTITVTPIFNGCPGAPKIFTITVNTTPDVMQLPNQTLCNGNFTTAMNFTSAVPGAIYNWTNTFAGIGIPASGTGDIASFQAFSNGNYTANATITVTPTFNGCSGAPKIIVLTVNPTPNVAQPADQTLCRNSSTTAITFAGVVAGTTYNWTNNNTAIGLAASGTGDIPSFTTTTNGFNVTVATITVTPSFNGCPGTPKTFTITVNPTPDIDQPNNQTLCNNNNTAAINFTGSVTGAIYTWSNSNTSIGLAANGTGDIPSFIATNNGATISTSTITVTSIFNGCTVPSKTFIIGVNPTPNAAQPVNQALCSNSNTAAITFNGAVAGTVYNWTNNNTAIGLPASGVGNIASFVAINNGSAVTSATITVTPSFNGCAGTPKTFTITVNPIPNMDPVANQQLCNGNLTSPINFTGTVGNTVYNWTNTAPSIGLAASGTGDIPSFKAISNGAFVSNATITVSAAANGCGIPNKTFTITVNPMPDVIQPLDQVVCNGAIINATNFTGSVTGAIYQWTNSNPAIGLPASGNGSIASFVGS